MSNYISPRIIKCNKKGCQNTAKIYKSEANKYGQICDRSEFTCSTVSGYRCSHTSSHNYYFCSSECMKYFEAHNRCYNCYENIIDFGTRVEELNITLCNGRGDGNCPCFVKYQLEKRFENDYKNNTDMLIYQIVYDIGFKSYIYLCNIPHDLNDVYQTIHQNDQKVSIDMLRDIYYLKGEHMLRERDSENKSSNLTNKCMDCEEELLDTFYYVNNGEKDGLVCCNIKDDSRNSINWLRYSYKGDDDCFIIKLCLLII